MTIFTQSLSVQDMFALASMGLALVFWIFVLLREPASNRWLNERLAARKNNAEPAADDASTAADSTHPKGPWG